MIIKCILFCFSSFLSLSFGLFVCCGNKTVLCSVRKCEIETGNKAKCVSIYFFVFIICSEKRFNNKLISSWFNLKRFFFFSPQDSLFVCFWCNTSFFFFFLEIFWYLYLVLIWNMYSVSLSYSYLYVIFLFVTMSCLFGSCWRLFFCFLFRYFRWNHRTLYYIIISFVSI